MSGAVVDVVIAVHNADRPIERAVGSALRNRVPLRVTIVAHNVDPGVISGRLGELASDARVRLLPLADGVRSPANAFNHGLAAATATYVSIVGSDDALEPGALDAWVAIAERTSADIVVAPIVRDSGHGVPTPRIRWARAGRTLDPDRDRLFERAAPLGLLRRSAVGDLRFTPGLPRGEDQTYGLSLWTSVTVIFDPDAPAYREHGDQDDRITHVFGPLDDDFMFVSEFSRLLESLPTPLRRAAAAKMIRVHLVPAVRVRASAGSLTGEDIAAAQRILEQMSAMAPGVRQLLPISLRAAVDGIAQGATAALTADAARRTSLLADLLPIGLSRTMHRHGPARTMWAGRKVARHVTSAYSARRAAAWDALEEGNQT